MHRWLLIALAVATAATDEAALPVRPPLLSRRAAALAASNLTLLVGEGGALALRLGR